MKKIIVAYHAYAHGDFIPLLDEQFKLVVTSGLYDACDKLYIGVTAANTTVLEKAKEWFNDKEDEKVEIVFYPENNEILDTLRYVKDYSIENPGDYVLFFHSKGITRQEGKPVEDWRRYMEYFNITRWKYCVEKLEEGYDCCGVLWNPDTGYGWYPHFSGCFWWATTDYINTLDHSYLDENRWRFDQEFWIGTSPNVREFEFHNSHLNDKENFINKYENHYSKEYPRNNYEI
jgi:hypothetical protein